ncbi:MAG: hypothetical protein WBW05_12115, partial [Candidatus Acidiferrum sp.]
NDGTWERERAFWPEWSERGAGAARQRDATRAGRSAAGMIDADRPMSAGGAGDASARRTTRWFFAAGGDAAKRTLLKGKGPGMADTSPAPDSGAARDRLDTASGDGCAQAAQDGGRRAVLLFARRATAGNEGGCEAAEPARTAPP